MSSGSAQCRCRDDLRHERRQSGHPRRTRRRDINGYFDNRLTDSVRQYMNGKGALTVQALTAALRNTSISPIAPYLYLVLANASAQQAPKDAIKYFDLARLEFARDDH